MLLWTDTCQKAFDILRDSPTVILLLAYQDPQEPNILYTDASDTLVPIKKLLLSMVLSITQIRGVPNKMVNRREGGICHTLCLALQQIGSLPP